MKFLLILLVTYASISCARVGVEDSNHTVTVQGETKHSVVIETEILRECERIKDPQVRDECYLAIVKLLIDQTKGALNANPN